MKPVNPWQYHITVHYDDTIKLFVAKVGELSKIEEYGEFPFQVYKQAIETIKKTTAMNTGRGVRTAQPKT